MFKYHKCPFCRFKTTDAAQFIHHVNVTCWGNPLQGVLLCPLCGHIVNVTAYDKHAATRHKMDYRKSLAL